MVEAELLSTLQSISYIAGATGVCIAAFYYIQILRNAEREKRRQMIMQKLPTFSREYYEDYLTIRYTDFDTPEEYYSKYSRKPEVESKIWHLLNIYNVLGILYEEGLMSLEDIAKRYTPRWIIRAYERFEFMILGARSAFQGRDNYPELFLPLEHLYHATRERYPGIAGWKDVSEWEKESSNSGDDE
jgi:hypothetical protein